MKKAPMRMCIACREMKPKKDMLRVVLMPDHTTYQLDESGKLNGRGAYICNDTVCLEKAIKAKLLNRAFKSNVDSNIYDEIKEKSIARKGEN